MHANKSLMNHVMGHAVWGTGMECQDNFPFWCEVIPIFHVGFKGNRCSLPRICHTLSSVGDVLHHLPAGGIRILKHLKCLLFLGSPKSFWHAVERHQNPRRWCLEQVDLDDHTAKIKVDGIGDVWPLGWREVRECECCDQMGCAGHIDLNWDSVVRPDPEHDLGIFWWLIYCTNDIWQSGWNQL